MHRGAFVTLASSHIKTVSLESIECVLVVCDHYPTSICISVLSVQQVKYSALNTLEVFPYYLTSTFNLIVSYWTNFLCYVLQTFSFGQSPQQFRARQNLD